MDTQPEVSDVLQNASETLETASFGLADLLGDDPRRRLPGLRNLIVFGRAVTNVLQKLRSAIGNEEFDQWYSEKQDEMRQVELLRYFYELRSEILKEGALRPVSTSMHIAHLNTAELAPLMANPPKGARSFFLGDQLGGSGWEVVLPDGAVTKYYVTLPGDLSERIETRFHFADAPSTHKRQRLTDTSIEALGQHYIEYLRALLAEARERFNP